MSHFYYDFTKTGAFDLTNGSATITVNSVQHNIEVCICTNCVAIRAAKRAEDEKRKASFHVHTHAHAHCCCHHHH